MFTIPNIFIAGKKAVAYEVNENFEAVKNEINKINSNIQRCERCKGAGRVNEIEITSGEKLESNCPDCGGAGLKWKGEVG